MYIFFYFSISSTQLLPADTLGVVKNLEPPTLEEAEVLGVSHVHVYPSCSNAACFNRKLVDHKCPNCSTSYPDHTEPHSIVCNVAISKDDEIQELTLFKPQIQVLINDDEFPMDDKDALEERVLACVPIKISFTPSPKKDKTVLSLARI